MKRFFLFLGFFLLAGQHAQALKLYLLSNHERVGDHNQALGIARAFKDISSEVAIEDLNTKETSSSQVNTAVGKDFAQGKVVVIGTGEGGIEGIKDLNTAPELTIILTSHMFLNRYRDEYLLKKVDFIALPSHVSAPIKELLGPKLIETTNVAHNRQAEVADATFREWGEREIPQHKSYLGVVLGGDAPTPANEIKPFTLDDARKLADYVAQHAGEDYVLVLNGPRTGKHDESKTEIPTAHRDGNLDRVTAAFKAHLEDKLGSERVKVIDFQFEGKPSYNSVDLVVGALRATNGRMIVPGESTSVVSETVDTLPLGQVLVYKNSAMNEVHLAHIASELAASRVDVLENYETLSSPDRKSGTPQPSAALLIARKVLDFIQN